MERIRWTFGLADPNEDVNIHPSILEADRYHRQMITPLGRFVRRCQDLCGSLRRMLWVAFKCLWDASLGRWLYVKRARLGKEEMATTRFVASHTSIPVPRMWMYFRWKGYDYLVMSRIKGKQLEEDWSKLSEDMRAIIAEQIRGYVLQLRAIRPPAGLRSICSVTGGPIRCFRLHEDGTTGPFRDEEHMNLQLRWLRPLEGFPPIVQAAHSRKHPLVFTHNDLAPRNIMVDLASGKVTGIVDWECAGWFPAHWEYCKAMNWLTPARYHAEFKRWIPRMIPVYEQEQEADRVLMYDMGVLYLSPTEHAP